METKMEAKEGTHFSKVGLSCVSSQVQDIFRFHLKIWWTYDTKFEWNTFVGFMIENLKILRTPNTKNKELEAVWYKVWVKWMIILVGETVTWPLPEQIIERSSRKINILQASFALHFINWKSCTQIQICNSSDHDCWSCRNAYQDFFVVVLFQLKSFSKKYKYISILLK